MPVKTVLSRAVLMLSLCSGGAVAQSPPRPGTQCDSMRPCADPDMTAFESARQFFAKGDASRGIETYYQGAETRSPASRRLYRADLALLANPAELAGFDSAATGNERASWIRRFWRQRDVAAGRSPGERLVEHNRRLRYAREHFRYIGSRRTHEPIFALRENSSEFDDRGLIYIRHGEPDMQATDPSLDIPNVSWLYRGADGNLIFHFRTGPDTDVVGGANYHLVESIVDILGFRNALQVRAGQPDSVSVLPAARELFRTRSGLDMRFEMLASSRVATGAVELERERGRQMVTRGISTDTYPLKFAHSLEPAVQGFGMASPTGGALVVPFGLPLTRLTPLAAEVGDGQAGYRIAFRLLALGPDGIARQLDTVRTFAVARAAKGYLTGLLELPAPAGEYALSLVVSQEGGNGTAVALPVAYVPDTSARSASLSSLVLGQSGGLRWSALGGTVDVNPLNTFPNDGSATLFYQVGGFRAAAPVGVRIELRSPGRKPVGLRFEEQAGPLTLARRTLDLTGLKPGEYHLTLSVSQAGTGNLTREADLYVTDRAGPGAQ